MTTTEVGWSHYDRKYPAVSFQQKDTPTTHNNQKDTKSYDQLSVYLMLVDILAKVWLSKTGID